MGSWNTSQYLNVYVYPESGLEGVLGIGTPPSVESDQDLGGSDFVIVANQAFSPLPPHLASNALARVLVHEVGHYLFLRHPWGFATDCNADDECPDTPRTYGPSRGCNDDTGCSKRAMIENYMDYTGDACFRLFTSCQKGRMRASLAFLRTNLYADSNNALDGDPPAIDMTLYKEFQESRPDALFFNSATGRFRVPELFVANQGQTAVSSATLVFAVNGTEVARFDATNNFGFCDVATLTVPSSVQDRVAATTLDLSRENTLAIWVDAAGENYRANDTLIITDRAKNAPSQTFSLSSEHLNNLPPVAHRQDVGATFGGGATDYHARGADNWVFIPGSPTKVLDGEMLVNELSMIIFGNPLPTERKDTIYFTPTGGVGKAVEDTLYITQLGATTPSINVSFRPATLGGLPAEGGTVTANIDILGSATEWNLTLPSSTFVTPSATKWNGRCDDYPHLRREPYGRYSCRHVDIQRDGRRANGIICPYSGPAGKKLCSLWHLF